MSLFTKLKSPNYSEKSNPNEKTKKKKEIKYPWKRTNSSLKSNNIYKNKLAEVSVWIRFDPSHLRKLKPSFSFFGLKSLDLNNEIESKISYSLKLIEMIMIKEKRKWKEEERMLDISWNSIPIGSYQ